MKINKNKTGLRKPSIFIAIGYNEIYDDYNTVNPLDLLDGIPTAAVLKFVAKKYSTVFYAQSDIVRQKQYIWDICPLLLDETRQKVWRFIERTEKAGNNVFLYGAVGCQMLYRLALQLNVPLEPDEEDELCEDEYEMVFKALLYCNSKWTNHQLSKEMNNIGDILLKMDISIADTKHYKDFRPQLYKARQFYDFCDNDALFKTYLPYFLKEKGVVNWGEYLTLLFGIYFHSIKNSVLPRGGALENKFLSQFVIDKDEAENTKLWDLGYKGLGYLRDHFLYELPTGEYLLLDSNLLIDKFYQSLKFELYGTVKKNNLLTAKGKSYKDQPQFNSTLGDVFSEKYLLYDLFDKTYNDAHAVKFSGEELKKKGISAELDYYLRIGNTLYLVEYKDIVFPDTLKYSDDIETIKQGIKDRLCKDNGDVRKGGGQLLYNIDRILNNGLMDALDPDVSKVTSIFPLLITTDMAFSAMGVNLVVTEEFDRIRSAKYSFKQPVMIYVPVIANLDSIILLSYRLHTSALQLNELLKDYIMGNWLNIASFDNYVWDECKEKHVERKGGLDYLLGNLVTQVASMTAWMQNGLLV